MGCERIGSLLRFRIFFNHVWCESHNDRYLSAAELEYLFQSAEVFVCAHTSEGQTSSGTLALALAAGAVPVSTPFAQAKELLAEGRGLLVPFRDPAGIAEAVRRSLSKSPRLHGCARSRLLRLASTSAALNSSECGGICAVRLCRPSR